MKTKKSIFYGPPFRWLDGFKPNPPCSLDDCHRVSLSHTPRLCIEHRCSCLIGDELCHHLRVPRRIYCTRHVCLVEKCKNLKLPEPQIYCNLHACFVCLEKNQVNATYFIGRHRHLLLTILSNIIRTNEWNYSNI